jgi:MFS transporter, DHA1 family, inner membrane transport protein
MPHKGHPMSDRKLYFEKKFRKKLFIPALAFAVFATTIIDVAAPLLLTDIAKTFQVQVGSAGIIRSSSAIAGVIFGLLMAVFSVRFKHKSLLLLGLACECLAGIGSFLAPTFAFMNIAHFFDGVGSVIVAAMAYSLIGECLPPEKRGSAIGWIVAAGSFGFIIGAPIIGLISNFAQWRSVMLWFVFPVSAASLVFTYFVISSKTSESTPTVRPPLLEGCKQTLSNISVLACLVGTLLFSAAGAMAVFLVSFWKYQFAINTSLGALTILINSTVGALGGIVAGRLLNRTGRKLVGVTAGLAESLLIIFMVLMPTFSLSWGLSAVRIWCFSFAITAFTSLSLEQVPKFRSTMMSLSGAFTGLGTLLGITIGGLTLDTFNYQTMGLVLGISGIASITIIAFLANDPKNALERNSILQKDIQ